MKYNLCFILILVVANIGISQCMQTKSNSEFSCNSFLSFVGSVEEGEEKLLSWDFCHKGTAKSKDGKVTYYEYRIDHSLNYNTSKYQFDIYSLTDDLNRFEYNTSSNRNFLAYKKKLINCGFTRISDDFYKKTINNKLYYMSLDRSAHSSGTPNYRIYINYMTNT